MSAAADRTAVTMFDALRLIAERHHSRVCNLCFNYNGKRGMYTDGTPFGADECAGCVAAAAIVEVRL